MLKFVNRFTLCLILILTLLSTRTAAAEANLKPSPWACLDRAHKEQVDVCLRENDMCHMALMKDDEAQPLNWEQYTLAGLAGIIAGAFLEGYLHGH